MMIVAGYFAFRHREVKIDTKELELHRKRLAKTIITTDTFVKVGGQWKLGAAHSSAVAYP